MGALRTLSLGLVAALALGACRGKIGEVLSVAGQPPGQPPPPPPHDGPKLPSFTCDSAQRPPSLPLRRLSQHQLDNALSDLTEALAPGQGSPILASVSAELAKLPEDQRIPVAGEKRGGFRRQDQALHQEHVDGLYAVAGALGRALSTPAMLGTVVGACATDGNAGNDAACIDDFINRLGERALRRPIDQEDLAFYRQVYGATGIDAAGVGDVIAVMFQSPELFYFVEHAADTAQPSGSYRLTAYELAARLSFHFWQTIPDAALLESARSGALLEDGEYRRQVERLSQDRRARAALDEFFTEWLWLDDLIPMNGLAGTPVYDAFADGYVPGPDLREHMIDELRDMGAYYVLDAGGSFEDLLTNQRSFARTQDVAGLYQLPVWSGSGEPPSFSDANRAGLLTRAGMLATGTANTRPIMKGVFIRKGLLCDAIPPPPASAAAVVPMLSPNLTTREVVEQLTEQSGSICAGCHPTLLNPLGYSTESFDALGRSRIVQRLFDDAGQEVSSKPVDTRSVPGVIVGDSTPSTGAKDVVDQMVASGKPQACFARTWFRFTFGRQEELATDGCTLEAVRSMIAARAPLNQVLARIALEPSFRERSFD